MPALPNRVPRFFFPHINGCPPSCMAQTSLCSWHVLAFAGALVWSPLVAATWALLVVPASAALSERQAAARLAAAVAAAEARVRAEAAVRVPATPPESSVWMSRLLGELWAPYVEPMLMKENLGNWQVGLGDGVAGV